MARNKKYFHPTKTEWAIIKSEYLSDERMSLPKIARKWNISESTLKQKSSRDKWGKSKDHLQSKQLDEKIDKVIEKNIDKAEQKNNEHMKIANHAVKLVTLVLNEMVKTYKEKNKTPIPQDLRTIVKALQEAVNLERVTVGLPTTVNHTDLTTKGKEITPVQNILQDQKVINLIKELNIDAGTLESLGAGQDSD